jgi:hypothetical protein
MGLSFYQRNFASLLARSAQSGEQNFCPFSDLKEYGAAHIARPQRSINRWLSCSQYTAASGGQILARATPKVAPITDFFNTHA